ncbi:hypothetical protein [uncultured Winogradskyella sp.]|uniref:hypothetical protein n=1 Tax=uncultured Winogradskyella sp. TaxID=395353 RepID=UPI0026193153|nr:hypothetical protein [uncultured Winogradskyella sp.]
MKFKLPFPINNNTISLSFVAIITIVFFIAGLFDVLDFIIIKVLLIGLTGALGLIVSIILFKKGLIKNRPEENPKDDSN